MSDSHGAFSLIQTPQALPGHCGGCGKPTWSQGFIDTGLQFEYYGALIFCGECVIDMATKFGLITEDKAKYLQSRVDDLEKETITQREALLGLEETIDGLLRTRAVFGSGDSPAEPTPEPEITDVPAVTPENSERDFVVTGTELAINTGESTLDNDNREQVPVGVSGGNGEFADSAELGLDV